MLAYFSGMKNYILIIPKLSFYGVDFFLKLR